MLLRKIKLGKESGIILSIASMYYLSSMISYYLSATQIDGMDVD